MCFMHLLACLLPTFLTVNDERMYSCQDRVKFNTKITELSIFYANVINGRRILSVWNFILKIKDFLCIFFIEHSCKWLCGLSTRVKKSTLQLQSNMCWSSNEPSAQKSILFSSPSPSADTFFNFFDFSQGTHLFLGLRLSRYMKMYWKLMSWTKEQLLLWKFLKFSLFQHDQQLLEIHRDWNMKNDLFVQHLNLLELQMKNRKSCLMKTY